MANRSEIGSSQGSTGPVETLPSPFPITRDRAAELGTGLANLRAAIKTAGSDRRASVVFDPQERQRGATLYETPKK